MSILKPIDFSDEKWIRKAAAALITGKAGIVEWSEKLNVLTTREPGKALLQITEGKAEAILRILPDPDFIQMEVHPDHALVSMLIRKLRINY